MTAELRWKYTAESPDGKIIRGNVMAPDQIAAMRLVKAEKLAPITIKEVSPKSFLTANFFLKKTRSLSLRDISEFCRNFAELLGAGLPVGKALELLAAQYKKTVTARLSQELSSTVRAGHALSKALENSPLKPPRLVIAMTAAGENTGKLAGQYEILARHYESQHAFRQNITAQLVYPAALLVLIIVTIAFLSHFVLPQFEVIFSNADTTPPVETQLVMAAGEWIRENAILFPLYSLSFLLGGRFIFNRYRMACEKLILGMPIIGAYLRKVTAGRFSRSMGALLVGGGSMTNALAIARQTINSEALRSLYEEASNNIRSGMTFTKAVSCDGLFPENMLAFSYLGEESGTLGNMLLKAADRCEQDIKADLTKITNLIGPIMTAVMGLLTAGVIAAVMSGVLSLNETIY